MGTQPIRVRLDLTKVQVSSYKYVWFPVSPCALNTIFDLKSNICRKFNLPTDTVQLFVEGGLMQDEDTVLLLRENDVIQIQYKKEAFLQDNAENVECISATTSEETQAVKICKSQNNISEEADLCSLKGEKLEDSSGYEKTDYHDQLDGSTLKKKKSKKSRKKKDKEPDFDNSPVRLDSSHTSMPTKRNYDVLMLAEDDCKDNEKFSCCKVKPKKAKKSTKCYENCNPSSTVESSISNFSSCDITASSKSISHIDFTVPNDDPSVNNNTGSGESIPRKITKQQSGKCALDMSNVMAEAEHSVETIKSTNCKKKKRKRKKKRKPDLNFSLCDSNTAVSTTDVIFHETPDFNAKGMAIKFSPPPGSEESESKVGGILTSEEKILKTKDLKLQTCIPCNVEKMNMIPSNTQSKESTLTSTIPVQSVNSEPKKSNSKFLSSLDSGFLVFEINEDSDQYVLNETSVHNSKIDKCNVPSLNGKLEVTNTRNSTPLKSTTKSVVNCVSTSAGKCGNKVELMVKQDYSQYPALNTLPPLGTHIAFKVLELSEMYCPEVSNYKEGVIVDVNTETDDVVIELAQHEIKAPRDGKFENLYPDDFLGPEVIRNVTAKWTELIAPKLIAGPVKSN